MQREAGPVSRSVSPLGLRGPQRSTLSYQMNEVLLVLAHDLDQLVVQDQALRDRDRPRLGIELRILDRHLDVQVSEVTATESLGQPHSIAVGMPAVIEPRDG